MQSLSLSELLLKASAVYGIVPEYWDISGKRHETSDDLRRAILKPLGVACDTAEDLAAALEARERARAARLSDPVLVLTEGDPVAIPVRTGADRVAVDLVLEDGSRMPFEIEVSGGAVTIPAALPLGYHEAHLAAGDSRSRTRVIICPGRAWLPASLAAGKRRAGLAVSLFGLRGEATWGCGDFTALESLIAWVAECGGSYVALNPLHAIHNRQPYNTSPYLPNSTYYRNLIYLDIARIPEYGSCPAAPVLRRNADVTAEIEACNASEFVEYERVAKLKLRFLRLLWDHFERREIAAGTARALAFERYCREGELLDRFATYCALDEYLHAQNPDVWIWPDWPEPYRDPESAETAAFRQKYDSAVRFHKYVQWLIGEQAAAAQAFAKSRGMEIGLFHDLPLATDRCGSELWANRRFFVNGCRVGSPPDDFSPKGQDWSFPPPNAEAHREDGYRLFAESIRKSARHGGALRIDHVMRLFRLYWIPDGYEATHGTYVKDRHEDLLRVLALESHRNQVLIVGEDLGTVEPYMREALDRFGILSYRLFYFEKRGDGSMIPFQQYPERALVSSTTHDLPTLAGFWSGRDIEARRELGFFPDGEMYRQAVWYRSQDKRRMFEVLKDGGFLPPDYPEEAASGPELSGELHSAVTGFLVFTPSLLMTLNQEDLTKELDQQNMPGTTWQYPNWRRKTKFTVEELHASPLAKDFAAMFRYWLKKSDRFPER